VTFTFDATDLSTALSQVRTTIHDTDSANPLLTDEQINWRLGQVSQDVRSASIRCVRDIMAALTRNIDRSNVGMSATRSQKFQQYKDLLAELKEEAAGLGEVFIGGTSDDEADTLNSDSDYIQASIKRRWGRNSE
jgi:hypothetical protein